MKKINKKFKRYFSNRYDLFLAVKYVSEWIHSDYLHCKHREGFLTLVRGLSPSQKILTIIPGIYHVLYMKTEGCNIDKDSHGKYRSGVFH